MVHLDTHGYADVEKKVPIAVDAIFRIYSTTKPITVVAVMMLCEQRLYALDDPIANYLPAFADMQVITDKGLVCSSLIKPDTN